jgi:hypothetical protein
MAGTHRAATMCLPCVTSRSLTAPPDMAPMIEQASGTDASTPVLAMLACCCISRYAGSQVRYIHTA